MTRLISPLPSWLLALLMLGFSIAVPADDTRIELIELKGRTAEELIPLLQPVVEPGGALSGQGYRLIVKATPAQQQEIRRLLDELDHAPRRLLFTVHMGDLDVREQRGAGIGIDKRAGGIGIELGGGGGPDGQGVAISQHDGMGYATFRAHGSRTVGEATGRQQVQGIEGEPAYIATGRDYPYPSHLEDWRGPRGGSGGAVGFEYKQTATGFYALARIRGNQAYVQISPQRETLGRDQHGAVDSQHLSTTVSVPVGSWVRIGESGAVDHRGSSRPGSVATTRELRQQPIWLKVETLR